MLIAGSWQGLQTIGDHIYLLGDGDTGIIRELDLDLNPTGWEGALTQNGVEIIGHPTGLAYQEGLPAFIGGSGRISSFDWDMFYEDRNLDRALQRTVLVEPLGTRPEYVHLNGEWLIASTGYSPSPNTFFIMDPEKLQTSFDVDEPGVILTRFEVPPYVQDIHWNEMTSEVILIRNIQKQKGWVFTSLDLDDAISLGSGLDEAITRSYCIPKANELEGYTELPDGRDLFVIGDDPTVNLFETVDVSLIN